MDGTARALEPNDDLVRGFGDARHHGHFLAERVGRRCEQVTPEVDDEDALLVVVRVGRLLLLFCEALPLLRREESRTDAPRCVASAH